ncbi:MAG: hypothetical protein R3B70_23345 [Polyangiaceae bacterium]
MNLALAADAPEVQSVDAVLLGAGDESAGSSEAGAGVLRMGWRAVRAGGVVVVEADPATVEEVAREVREVTGAGAVWSFVGAAGARSGLRAIVIAVKGRPRMGPEQAYETALNSKLSDVDPAAIAAGHVHLDPAPSPPVVSRETSVCSPVAG